MSEPAIDCPECGAANSSLDTLVDSVAGSRILLLVSYRPEYEDHWAGRSWHRRISLSGLGAVGAEVLAASLLGEHPSVAKLHPLLVRQTEGRPLFIEETVRALAEEGRIVGVRGDYRLVGTVDHVRIPESVQAVLAARMDCLEPETKQVLQTASVIGRTVPLPLLKAVCGAPADALDEHVHRLLAAEFLFEHRVVPAPEYVFKHALTRAAAYEGLLRRRRAELHASALDAMESLQSGALDENLEALARHAFQGERWEAAVDYLRRAARKATAQSAYQEARDHLEQALDALDQLPEGGVRAVTGVDIRLEMRPALGATGHYPEILARLEEAEALARAAGDEGRLLQVCADRVHVLYHLGRCASAIEVGEQAVASARASGDRRVLVQASQNLAHAHFWRGEFRHAVAISSPWVEELAGPLRHDCIGTTATSSCLWIGNVCGMHAMLGQSEEALRLGHLTRTIAKETGRPFDHCISGSWLGVALMEQGLMGEALEVLDESYDTAVGNDLDFIRLWVGIHLGGSLRITGRAEDARALLADLVASAEHLELVTMGLLSRIQLAETMLDLGETARARTHCETAFEKVRVTGFRWAEPGAMRVLARAKAAEGEDGWEELLGESVDLCQAQGTAPQLARTRLDLGRLLAGSLRNDEARGQFEQALGLFRELRMNRYVEQVEAAMMAIG